MSDYLSLISNKSANIVSLSIPGLWLSTISVQPAGSVVYNLSDDKIYFSNGSDWVKLGSGSASGLTPNPPSTNRYWGSGTTDTTQGWQQEVVPSTVNAGYAANAVTANSAVN